MIIFEDLKFSNHFDLISKEIQSIFICNVDMKVKQPQCGIKNVCILQSPQDE